MTASSLPRVSDLVVRLVTIVSMLLGEVVFGGLGTDSRAWCSSRWWGCLRPAS